MKLFNIILTIFALVSAAYAQAKYCNMKSCNGMPHIGCTSTGAFGSSCVSNAKVEQMTQGRQDLIVSKHNTLRNQQAGGFNGFPKASRMGSVVWDPELAQLAELNVKQCSMTHDGCRNTESYGLAGQNLAAGWSSQAHVIDTAIEGAIQRWYDEYKLATPADINKLEGARVSKIGHFTAMCQEKSHKVGCAYLSQFKDDWYEYYLACNYSYTNLGNSPVYTSGEPGSKCTTGVNAYFKNLCSINENY